MIRMTDVNRIRRMRAKGNSAPEMNTGVYSPVLLAELFPNGSWEGKRCFLIGGGPSLKGFDFSRLNGELVIGMNRSFEYFDPTIQVTIDDCFIGWADKGQFGPEALQKWRTLKAPKAFAHKIWNSAVKNHYWIPCHYLDTFSWDLRKLGPASCSGYIALNIACCLRASEVYLLGFDMNGSPNSRQQHFHSGYPTKQTGIVNDRFRPLFEQDAEKIKNGGVRVINLNPDSGLRCFEFGNVDDALKPKQGPLWIAYYTIGTGYEKEAERLEKSLRKFNQKYKILPIENQGSWQKNTQYKARLLQSAVCENMGGAIVYTDADSELQSDPSLFMAMPEGVDIAYHTRPSGEVLSGTIYIQCNEKTMGLMSDWVACCERNPEMWDQKCLDIALRGFTGKKYPLPVEYCCIFDGNPGVKNPVIVHYQASRRLKREINR